MQMGRLAAAHVVAATGGVNDPRYGGKMFSTPQSGVLIFGDFRFDQTTRKLSRATGDGAALNFRGRAPRLRPPYAGPGPHIARIPGSAARRSASGHWRAGAL